MEKLKNFNLNNLFFLSLTITFLTFCLNSYWAFFLSVLLCFVVSIVIVFLKTKSNDKQESFQDKRAVKYIAFYNIFIALSSIFVVGRNIQFVLDTHLVEFVFLAIFIIALMGASIFLLFKFKTFNRIDRKVIFEYLPIFIIGILVFVFSIDDFFMYPKWDSNAYYNAMLEMNINSFNDIGVLKLCNHISVVYAIFVYITYCCIGDMFVAATLLNIILNIFGAVCVYKFVKLICPNANKIYAYLCSLVFAFSPFTFGMNGYISLDYVLMYTCLFFLYSCAINNKNLIAISSLFFFFFKEQGVLLTFVLIFIPILHRLIKSIKMKNFKQELKQQMSIFNICEIIFHIAFVVIFLLGNWAQDGGWYEFAIDGQHILNSLNNIITINFNWILLAIIFIDVIKLIVQFIRKKQSFKQFMQDNIILSQILTVGIVMLMFNLIVITWNHPRYHLIEILALYLLAFFALYDLFKDGKFKKFTFKFQYLILVLILPLLIGQSYFTIDPVMISANNKVYMGTDNNYMVSTKWISYSPDFAKFHDCAVYNKQANYYELAFDKLLNEIDYNTNICLLAGTHESYFIENMAWNPETKRRYFTNNEDEMIKYDLLIEDYDLEAILSQGYTYYFIDFHSGTNGNIFDANDKPDKDVYYYIDGYDNVQVESSGDVEFFGWRFTYSKLIIS